MTEIGLTVALSLAGLVFAAFLARWTVPAEAGSGELRRLSEAIRRATDTLLWGSYRATGVAVGLVAGLLFAAHGYLGGSGPTAGLGTAFHASLFLGAGAGGACLTAHIAAHLARVGSVRAAAAAKSSLDAATAAAARAGAAAALVAAGASVVVGAVVAALVFALQGGFSGEARAVMSATTRVATLLPAYALGSGIAALVLQLVGSAYRTAAHVGACIAGEGQAGLEPEDARNPARIACLVGSHVGAAAAKATDLHLAVSSAAVVAALLGVAAEAATHARGLALLPFVVLAFGLLATAFGVMVVRLKDEEDPGRGLWRGQATTLVVTVGGHAGACVWLLEASWLPFFLGGTLTLVSVMAAAHVQRLRHGRRVARVRDVEESGRAGVAPLVGTGLGAGLEAALLPTLVAGLALSVAWELGARSQVPLGGPLATWTAIMALLAASPSLLGIGAFVAVAHSSLGVLAMSPASGGGDTNRRSERLDAAGFQAALVSEPYLLVTSCLLALSVVTIFPVVARVPTAVGESPVNLADPLVAWSSALGVAVVLAAAGYAIRFAVRGVRHVAGEVERQLRRFPRERGAVIVPRDFAPSYRACVDLAQQHALSGLYWPVGAVILVPPTLALAVGLVGRPGGAGPEALTAFLAAAALTALGVSLAFEGAGSLLFAHRRTARQRGVSMTDEILPATFIGEAVAGILRGAASPPTATAIKVVAMVALVVVPFLA